MLDLSEEGDGEEVEAGEKGGREGGREGGKKGDLCICMCKDPD